MQVSSKKSNETTAELEVSLSTEDLSDVKRSVFNKLRVQVKAAGFRPGKAPDNIVEKELGAQLVQGEVIDAALNRYYPVAVAQEKIDAIGQPEVKLKSFVPYTELKFTATIEVAPDVQLPDYQAFKIEVEPETVTSKQVAEVMENIRQRMAKLDEVKRPAKVGDEVVVDFKGTDSKGEEIAGASGSEVPIRLGSKSFIPGFEEEIVGLKSGEEKTFEITFPKDYRAETLRNKKAKFKVKVLAVKAVELPEVNDELATKIGPFKTVEGLKEDIRKQLQVEQQNSVEKQKREEIVKKLVDGAKMKLPTKLINNVLEDIKQELYSNLQLRGMQPKDFYEQEGLSEEEYEKKELRPAAERRVKASLALNEVAKRENIKVSNEELEAAMEMLKQRYAQDEKALASLEKPETRQDIALRVLTEKTVDKLLFFAKSK